MEIPAGAVIGLAGESGSGKSTCIKLLLGLLSADRGSVLVDGCNLAQIHLPSYYRCIAYTPQEPPVFDGTLRENIVFDRDIPDEKIL